MKPKALSFFAFALLGFFVGMDLALIAKSYQATCARKPSSKVREEISACAKILECNWTRF